MAEISQSQKANLHEVAQLMLEIYETLSQMRYFETKAIQNGPHDITKMRPVYEKHGLDPAIIYLYSILPYVDSDITANTSFFDGGNFADFRKESHVEEARDPLCLGPSDGGDYEDEDGPYMRPWMTALSLMGNHTSVIIYDARKHRIWIPHPEDEWSYDPALNDEPNEAPQSNNENSFEHLPSRPAGDVLQDIARWYRELELLPGGGENSGIGWDTGDLDQKGLYLMHGWPDNFDGIAFQVNQLRALCVINIRNDTKQILPQLRRCMISVEESSRTISRLQKSLAAAKSKNEEWIIRMELWKAGRSHRRNSKELVEGELKLNALEYRQANKELKSLQDSIRRTRKWLEEESKDADADTVKRLQGDLYREEQSAILYEAVKMVIEADTNRLRNEGLRGKTAFAKEKEASIGQGVSLHFAGELEALRKWAAQIPDDAKYAKEKVNEQIQDYERSVAATTAHTWLNSPGLFDPFHCEL
ncbi:hypothetical protein ASPBRDRAFT_503137 [Aspergillus brasiliensis CBS 101740]|uniref:Uncharacterized protein n=1 Tax=Aspergillus brasiliensis (strain CBS 101740 / IMI 381727 / IBT 21946) TaxID=767769 RepID=A0A1L9UNT9_ASPBC|nr:hypothetical protein ASPBRDRAFT_503137 [Aspergillus brasiliensis CBS 101740]